MFDVDLFGNLTTEPIRLPRCINVKTVERFAEFKACFPDGLAGSHRRKKLAYLQLQSITVRRQRLSGGEHLL